MNKLLLITPVLAVAAAMAFAQDVHQPMPSAANPYVGHGGLAWGRGRALNDLELTVVTRAGEAVSAQSAVLQRARQEFLNVTFRMPLDTAALTARLQALADAEYQLALVRADAFVRVKAELKATSPEKIEAIKRSL